jgi:hypothetical protein
LPSGSGVADGSPEPTRMLSADQTQIVGKPHTRRRWSRPVRAAAAVVVALLTTAAAGFGLWQTTKHDRLDRRQPSTAIVRQEPPTRPALVTVTLRYHDRVWTQCKVDGRLAFEGIAARGERRTWTARQRVELVLGNPTGVELVVDGRVLGRPNGHGHPWRGAFRPNGPLPPLA